MDAFSGWITRITAAAILLSAASAIAPSGSGRRMVRFTGGLILFVVMIKPLAELSADDLSFFTAQYTYEFEGLSQELESEGDTLRRLIIEDKAASYILKKADELGLDCEAEVTASARDEGTPYPVKVAVTYAAGSDPEAIGELSRIIAADLAVDGKNQSWSEMDGD